jgi:DNA-binding NarL/FixJ family response regulator
MAEALPSREPVTVLVVDPHAVTRLGMRAVLAAEPDIQIVGECGAADDALELATSLSPHVAVVDVTSVDPAGFGLIKDLRLHAEHTRTLVCSAALPLDMIRHLLAIGAAGYHAKDEPAERLVEAVQKVAEGRKYLDPDTTSALLEAPSKPKLSGCQLEIMHLIGHGEENHAIAELLHKSLKTIETNRSRIKKKLGLRNTTVLAQVAWQMRHRAG